MSSSDSKIDDVATSSRFDLETQRQRNLPETIIIGDTYNRTSNKPNRYGATAEVYLKLVFLYIFLQVFLLILYFGKASPQSHAKAATFSDILTLPRREIASIARPRSLKNFSEALGGVKSFVKEYSLAKFCVILAWEVARVHGDKK